MREVHLHHAALRETPSGASEKKKKKKKKKPAKMPSVLPGDLLDDAFKGKDMAVTIPHACLQTLQRDRHDWVYALHPVLWHRC